MSNKKQNTKNIWKYIKILAIIAIVAYFITGPVRLLIGGIIGMNERLPQTDTLSSKYKGLFKNDFTNQFKQIKTFNSTKRSPVSVFDIQDKYTIFVYQISSSFTESLGNTLHIKKGSTDKSKGVGYLFADNGGVFNLCYAIGEIPKCSDLFLTFDADTIQRLVVSDSIVAYYFEFKKLSLKYKKDGKNDIVIAAKEDLMKEKTLPAELLFIKREHDLYMILMSVKNERQLISSDLLLKMIK